MKHIALTLTCEAEMDCPKEVVMWNYYDHEHLVGTHYQHYDQARILAERDDWALVYRKKKMPLLPLSTAGIALQFMDGNTMRVFHKDSIGFLLEQTTHFEDLPGNRSKVRVIYTIHTHPFFKLFEAIFQKLFQRWFTEVWAEDVPMRLRRWKVYQLGFKDYGGIDYINEKRARPADLRIPPYEFKPPLPTLAKIKSAEGEVRPEKGEELGYNESA